METIRNYLDNMFAGLPKTARVMDLKNNILSNMEEKYNELKSQGKSENEAIGIVISEFGNIEELVNELGIRKDGETASLPVVTREEVENYMTVKKTMGIQVGIGVFLCILGPALLILINHLLEKGIIANDLSSDTTGIPGVIILLVLVALAVGIFIYSGMNFERYQYMENGVQLPGSLEADLKSRYDAYYSTFNLKIIFSICLLVLSPITIFIANMMGEEYDVYGIVVLLLIVAIAVFMLIASGTVKESYDRLLKIGDYTTKHMEVHKKEDKVIGAVAAVVWPLAALVFLFCGFVYGLWYIAWIVFPITGILFGMFSAAYSIMASKEK
ncbi:MAG TPA: permease prefix domain 1-containing protein [Mobilitalea sp.]|nr:permease prefix domain 1-containing protein [Mobilitalea sp.]